MRPRGFSTLLLQTSGGVAFRLMGAGLGFMVNFGIAAALEPANYGIYSIFMAAALMIGTITAFGWPALATREAAAMKEDKSAVSGLVRCSLRSTTLGAIIGAATIAGCAFSGLIDSYLQTNVDRLAILFGVCLIPLISLSLVRAGLLRGLHQVLLADLPDLLIRPFVMLVFVHGTGLLFLNRSITTILSYQLIAFGLSFLIGLYFLRPHILDTNLSSPPTNWLRAATPFWAIAVVGLFSGQAPLYLAGVLGGPEVSGLFTMAGQLSGLVAMCIISIEMPLQGRLSEAWASGNRAESERLARAAGRLGLAVASTGAIAVLTLGQEILTAVGPDYAAATNALIILTLGQVLVSASGPSRVVLSMSGQERVVLKGVSSSLLITALVALAVIPTYGVTGAAAALVVGTSLMNSVFLYVCWRSLGISTSPLLPSRQ